ncbi:SprT-like domain-containing protein [Leucobacter sp. cx-328]|uniref:SprT-like domain-containing protein n=1 Tax=unclassified Leucobacter TaxID=2621730 RepID=UPI00165E864C|nr:MULTISPECIES: SprT-like domain-containing protein [unclassified Leucobacter]MBC9944316.1 SprT-like domain-containing protein [Leucobacter sp. cx-328]
MALLAEVRALAEALIAEHLGVRGGAGSGAGAGSGLGGVRGLIGRLGSRTPAAVPPAAPWTFDFDRAKRRAGLCNFTDRRITVSRYLAEKYELEEVRQILLHEVAHALVGPDVGHGPQWRSTAASIGYTGGRTHDGEIAHEQAPWVGQCPAGHEFFRFRKPTRPSSCTKCASGYSPEHGIRWRRR